MKTPEKLAAVRRARQTIKARNKQITRMKAQLMKRLLKMVLKWVMMWRMTCRRPSKATMTRLLLFLKMIFVGFSGSSRYEFIMMYNCIINDYKRYQPLKQRGRQLFAGTPFLSRHRSAETLCWLWYVVVVGGLISIFMNPMRMRLNYKMASTSSNKIKLAAGV